MEICNRPISALLHWAKPIFPSALPNLISSICLTISKLRLKVICFTACKNNIFKVILT